MPSVTIWFLSSPVRGLDSALDPNDSNERDFLDYLAFSAFYLDLSQKLSRYADFFV